MSTRTELEKEIYDFISDCDPSGKNTERMKALFKTMDDKKFYKYMQNFFNDDNMNFQIGYEPFDNPVNTGFIEKIAKKHSIPLYERIYKPFVTESVENPPSPVHPVAVIDVPIKRLKQMVMSKSHTSITNSKRDSRTGQVSGSDKTARVTDVEAFSLIVQELYSSAEELYGPMSDDLDAMYEMLRIIQRDGEVSLQDLPKETTSRVTMNTIQYYMWGAGVTSNLIDESSYLMPITLKNRDQRTTTIDRGRE